jgi:hypothetical protein
MQLQSFGFLFLTKESKTYIEEKIASSTNDAGEMGYPLMED